ncbi:hypothetical protein IJM86_01280 [bacterium]|nr:hypothetical protein [bacterium]
MNYIDWKFQKISNGPKIQKNDKTRTKGSHREHLHPEPWVKQEIITICDEQISAIPELDRNRYIYAIRSMEHPEGVVLHLDAHPCLRIREGVIVR